MPDHLAIAPNRIGANFSITFPPLLNAGTEEPAHPSSRCLDVCPSSHSDGPPPHSFCNFAHDESLPGKRAIRINANKFIGRLTKSSEPLSTSVDSRRHTGNICVDRWWNRLAPAHYQSQRREVLRCDGWRCQSCGSRSDLQIHHIEARSHLGDDSEQNLVTLCAHCHRLRHRNR